MLKFYSGNQSFLRDLNLITALRQIRSKGLISRVEIADLLGLNRSTITAIINELIDQKLVREVGTGASKGGRPPTLLQFNIDAAYIVCIDWGSRQIKIYITDLGGKTIVSESLSHEKGSSTTQIKKVIQVVMDCLSQLPSRELGVLGIGIGVPGVTENGMVSSYELGWDNWIPLRSYFSEDFNCPIIIDSDANAGLIAENYFGSAIGESNFCYVRIGREINAGILMNGDIYRGSEGFAGRVGHVTIEANGKKCTCGNRGCLAAYVSERALVQRYLEISGSSESVELVDTKRVINLFKENDPYAISAIYEFVEYLGIGISNIVNFLNPSLIIIDNQSIGQIDYTLYNPLNTILQQRVLPFLRRNVRVIFSSLGENAISLGATALVLDHIFSTPSLRTESS